MPQFSTHTLLLILIILMLQACSADKIQHKFKEIYSFQQLGKDSTEVTIAAKLDSLQDAIEDKIVRDTSSSMIKQIWQVALKSTVNAAKSVHNEYELMHNGEGYMSAIINDQVLTSQKIIWKNDQDTLHIILTKGIKKSFAKENNQWIRRETHKNTIQTVTLQPIK